MEVGGVPYLRPGRDALVGAARAALGAGDPAGAAAVLLRDADDWWDGPLPDEEEARAAGAAGTLREAVRLLRLGRVGDYLVHRWSDPVLLAGLGLLSLGWPAPGTPVLDLACGTGPLLRELALRGQAPLAGADVVLAKLWLARRHVLDDPGVAVAPRLVCLDAAQPWPGALAGPVPARTVVCLDALYFLPDPAGTAARMRAAAGQAGSVLVGGVPNGLLPARGGGARLTPHDLAAMLPGAELYDDADLVRWTVEREAPRVRTPDELGAAVTVSALWRAPGAEPVAAPDLGAPLPGRRLRLNPLYGPDGALRWPSERYERDYADRSPYLPPRLPDEADLAARPEHWARRRVLLDLPERW
ncbi:class I SAM-dependent methyltransferase [Vallicoccus soli]|uniref:Class I SAM-dependent methyltransferase n=1 Tax=Vallicoccus soli TaxID=2339232 RepID=A0A3A3Z0C5_9ACTN|nr:class I SAM-dependent methyltransferase [Vallicoccus soli]